MLESGRPLKVFISYSHKDDVLRQELYAHLATLGREGIIETSYDGDVDGGAEWKCEIDTSLDTADIILLLVSADFLDSIDCMEAEVRRAMELRERGSACVVPVILRPCDWKSSPFGKLQALPEQGKAATTWDSLDSAFESVTVLIRRLAAGLRSHEIRPPTQRSGAVPVSCDHLRMLYRTRRMLAAANMETRHIEERISHQKWIQRRGPDLFVGMHIGHYELLGFAGQGGFGSVWRAWDEDSQMVVALKILHAQWKNQDQQARFDRGAAVLRKLTHPYIVRSLSQPTDDRGFRHYAMEYADSDLAKELLRGTLSQADVIEIVLRVGSALTYVHEAGNLHRDIKPTNILLNKSKDPKITDFDLVRPRDTNQATRSGHMGGGSIVYTAPELLKTTEEGDEFENVAKGSPASDIYALGMTLLAGLYGKHLPIEACCNVKTVLNKVKCPKALKHAIEIATALNPDNRFQAICEFCEAIANPGFHGDRPNATFDATKPSTEEEKMPLASAGMLSAMKPPPDAVVIGLKALNSRHIHHWSAPIGVKIEMVYVPGGEFWMGSKDDPEAYGDEKPCHRRFVCDDYWIGRFPITVGEFREFVEATGYRTEAEKQGGARTFENGDWEYREGRCWRNPGFEQANLHPVTCTSWNDANKFCKWAELTLPTEAQWERAARASGERKYPWGNERLSSERCIWDCHRVYGERSTAPVGSVPDGASPYGALDMCGNVWEWCLDEWDEKDYTERNADMDIRPSSVQHRVYRGGSWYSERRLVRAACRRGDVPSYAGASVGFRVVLNMRRRASKAID